MNQQLDVIGDRVRRLDDRDFNPWRGLDRRRTGTRRRIRDDENRAEGPDLGVTLFEDAVVVRAMMRAAMRFRVTVHDDTVVRAVVPAFVDVRWRGEWNPRHRCRQRKPGKPRQGHDSGDPKRISGPATTEEYLNSLSAGISAEAVPLTR